MNDSPKALKGVQVLFNNGGDEYYKVGVAGITSVEWGETNGHMAPLKTVRVFKDGAIHSEHPFANVLGVYYAASKEQPDGQ